MIETSVKSDWSAFHNRFLTEILAVAELNLEKARFKKDVPVVCCQYHLNTPLLFV